MKASEQLLCRCPRCNRPWRPRPGQTQCRGCRDVSRTCMWCAATFTAQSPRRQRCDACRHPTCERCGGPRSLRDRTSRFCRECARLSNLGGNRDVIRPDCLPRPTHALPGSAEKVAVLEARYLARERLWHPLDATIED